MMVRAILLRRLLLLVATLPATRKTGGPFNVPLVCEKEGVIVAGQKTKRDDDDGLLLLLLL